MKRILAILLLVLIALTGVIAAAETASEADIASIDSAAVEAVDEEASNEEASEEAAEPAVSRFYQTFWALLPPIIAIGLALITKEVYSSLFIGIVVGGLLYSNFSFEGTLNHVFSGGIVSVLSDTYNVGILVFLVILGILVCILNRAGGSAAFGRWAAQHIKTNIGAQLATIALGVLIFIDDYFNCLTVGSVMRPVCDKHKVSRAKLAYLIDATAAPVCIIAPVSSWAAAVSSYVEDGNGLQLFLRAIPFNFYALLTIVMMFVLAIANLDYGPMRKHERNAREHGDIFSGIKAYAETAEEESNPRARVIDLVLPIAILIITCVTGMIYSGGFFSGASFVEAFSNSDASVGLMLGSAVTLVFAIIYFMLRRLISFKHLMECIPEGFKAMVPAVLILTFAWSLKAMTDSLGAKQFVEQLVKSSAGGFKAFLPAIIFAIGCGLSFATGTSWGTFGILIPITLGVFPLSDPLGIVCVSACMAGAVCGDHCSPISDTTIMASAGAQCDHVTHVATQLPYALTVAAVSFVSYIIAGFVPNALIVLPIAIV
ncbi:MAG: Na+/H+ antiporter NhaC family protein, partial [Clostridia bacterium]|nr:Na+/H+ antiporter NhaC family protein [Clostridia bacterium]